MTTNKYAAVSLGTVEAVFNKLGGVEGIKRFLADHVEVVIKYPIIYMSADPFIPDGWKVESHQKTGDVMPALSDGRLFLDGKKIDFFLSPNQAEGMSVKGEKLHKELEGKRVLNANVLDYLLKYPELIPESWKKDEQGRRRYINFWGTIYRRSDRLLYVRFLSWSENGLYWSYSCLDSNWDIHEPAVVLAS